jgi:membrane-bound lytic murein transglycosylase
MHRKMGSAGREEYEWSSTGKLLRKKGLVK